MTEFGKERAGMKPERKAIQRTRAIAQEMGAKLPQRPLSHPAERVHAETSHVIERHPRELSHIRSSQAFIESIDDIDTPMPLHESVLIWLGIVICLGMMALLFIERFA